MWILEILTAIIALYLAACHIERHAPVMDESADAGSEDGGDRD